MPNIEVLSSKGDLHLMKQGTTATYRFSDDNQHSPLTMMLSLTQVDSGFEQIMVEKFKTARLKVVLEYDDLEYEQPL